MNVIKSTINNLGYKLSEEQINFCFNPKFSMEQMACIIAGFFINELSLTEVEKYIKHEYSYFLISKILETLKDKRIKNKDKYINLLIIGN